MFSRSRLLVISAAPLALVALSAVQAPHAGNENRAAATASHIQNAFSAGWMLQDTNHDGVVDFINGKIVVPAQPTAAENSAAANIAARLAFGSTGLTPPLVVSANEDDGNGPRIWIGKGAVPTAMSTQALADLQSLAANQGGVFAAGENLVVLGHDDAGLIAASDAYAARAPYMWKVPGDQLPALINEINHDSPNAEPEIESLIYEKGKAGITRVLLKTSKSVTTAQLHTALASSHLTSVHELVVRGHGADVSAISAKALPAITTPPAPAATPSVAAPDTPPAAGPANSTETEGQTPQPLDLATLYTSKGLFKGTPKMPIPSSLDAQLLVPAGRAGIAIANLAARMGLETTGLSLPVAKPVTGVTAREVRTKAVLTDDSPLGKAAVQKLNTEDTAGTEAETALGVREGEIRIVDHAFGRQPAVLVRGDEEGAVSALNLINDRFPNLWEVGKQYASLEEMRYDLHRFFSLRSEAGQAAVSLYHLQRWADEINKSGSTPRDVKAEVYVDLAYPGLDDFVRKQLETSFHGAPVQVTVGSLHAGTKCCTENPQLHFDEPGYSFHQAAPTFTEDLTIPWEGTRLLDMVKNALSGVQPSQTVTLVARVSEGPQVREKLKAQLAQMLSQRGVDANRTNVVVLCAYKQGYSWLMDEIAPELKGKSVQKVKIEFAKDVDPTGVRVMYSPSRWGQELYPVDEMLAKDLNIPLTNIEISEFEPANGSPTYRVHAYNGSGAEILSRDFAIATAMRPYNGVMPRYEQVQVETGWVQLKAGTSVILDKRINTDIEEFWEHYQDETLPKVFHYVMAQSKGDIKPEFAPPFDTLRMDIHMSEPDYAIGLDKERISSLEALQEDTFYSTENFVDMMGNLEAGKPINYVGRIIPIVHASEDGQDGHVHIEFFGKPAANPMVRLKWTDAQGQEHENERDLPVLTGAMQPRLIRARVKAGEDGIDDLTWLLPADYNKDDFQEWIKVEPQEQVERSVFSVEQAKGQIHWLEAMHQAGLYPDDVAYPHLHRLGFEFELPVPLTQKADSPPPRYFAAIAVQNPGTPRPMIAQYSDHKTGTPIVQWDEPISPDESAAILARLATFPGVNVYWMGRSYLGRNIWAADFMLPSPAQLRSWPKETTLKASIIYSGRQHANEVSSTSHISKLGEQLATDPATTALLKQVNVVLHPIDNPDGAQLSIVLAKITPDNLLHPGYHGSLAADVATGQSEQDPVYPESRTRRLLLESWLPDGFLNPHGYPSHEWVQPFSEYTGWVQTREGANPGRAWWIPRGWFTSLTYIRDPEHPYSEKVTYELRDKIVEAERNVPNLLPLEERMNDRYQRWGQRWQPKDMTQPIVNGIRIYMALKGNPAQGAGQRSGAATGGVSPDVTWDAGYTEAPDETAHGDYMKLMASAGLAFDRVHLTYLANGKLRIRHVQREAADKVTWQVLRDRPNLPASELSNQKTSNIE